MQMHVLSGGRLRLRKGMYLPDAERSETLDAPVSCYLLRHAQGNVLFDSGCHPQALADPLPRWGGMTKVMTPIGSPDVHLISELSRLSMTPDDIDVVINSHLHSDHCGCNDFFKRATMICHARELAAATAADGEAKGFLAVDWTPRTPFDTFEGQRDLYGDGRIVLVPLPGHTPGMTGALVQFDQDGRFLLASDAVALAAVLARDLIPRNTWDAEAAARSNAEVRRLQEAGVKIVYGHDPGQWHELRRGEAFYA